MVRSLAYQTIQLGRHAAAAEFSPVRPGAFPGHAGEERPVAPDVMTVRVAKMFLFLVSSARSRETIGCYGVASVVVVGCAIDDLIFSVFGVQFKRL